MDESKQSGNSLDRTTAFIGFAIVFALLLAFAAYFVVQVNQLNNKVATQGGSGVSDRLLVIETRLSILERSIAPAPIQLKLFYDSSDNYTKDVVAKVAAAQADLAAQNLAITLVDRKADLAQYRKDGFNSIPAIFISKTEASRDKNLLASLQEENQAFDGNTEGFRIEALGFIFDRKRLLETACTLPDGKVSLDQFTNFECPYCAGMYNQVQNYVSTHADSVQFTQRHFPLKSLPNAWNASIASECARDQGKFDEFTAAAYLANANLSTAKYLQIAKAVGVSDMAKFTACLSDETKGLKV
ncbi:MAG TPA: DsbA family protein, partial [archaeon]|nr:DsbA family protein [archaeon]